MARKPTQITPAEAPPKRYPDRYSDDPTVGMNEIMAEAAQQPQPLRVDQAIARGQAVQPDLTLAVQWMVNNLVETFPPRGERGPQGPPGERGPQGQKGERSERGWPGPQSRRRQPAVEKLVTALKEAFPNSGGDPVKLTEKHVGRVLAERGVAAYSHDTYYKALKHIRRTRSVDCLSADNRGQKTSRDHFKTRSNIALHKGACHVGISNKSDRK
jgi:hypothetical protein